MKACFIVTGFFSLLKVFRLHSLIAQFGVPFISFSCLLFVYRTEPCRSWDLRSVPKVSVTSSSFQFEYASPLWPVNFSRCLNHLFPFSGFHCSFTILRCTFLMFPIPSHTFLLLSCCLSAVMHKGTCNALNQQSMISIACFSFSELPHSFYPGNFPPVRIPFSSASSKSPQTFSHTTESKCLWCSKLRLFGSLSILPPQAFPPFCEVCSTIWLF